MDIKIYSEANCNFLMNLRKYYLRFQISKSVKSLLIVLFAATLGLLLISQFFFLKSKIPEAVYSADFWGKYHEPIRNYSLTVMGVISLYFLFVRTRASDRTATASLEQMKLTRNESLTESFHKSIENLIHNDLVVRLGAICSLEKIANSSDEYNYEIMKVLSAFVRQSNNKTPNCEIDSIEALKVIGKRPPKDRNGFPFFEPIDLSNLIVQNIDLSNLNFQKCDFSNCNLSSCSFENSNLRFATLANANLQNVSFKDANLDGVNFESANLQDAILQPRNFNNSNLKNIKGKSRADMKLQFERLYNFKSPN